jgi:hypothetical protein
MTRNGICHPVGHWRVIRGRATFSHYDHAGLCVFAVGDLAEVTRYSRVRLNSAKIMADYGYTVRHLAIAAITHTEALRIMNERLAQKASKKPRST